MTPRGWFDLIGYKKTQKKQSFTDALQNSYLTKDLNECNFNKKKLKQTCHF